MKPQDVFSLTAILPLLVALIAFTIEEEPLSKSNMNSNVDSTIMDMEATTTTTATNDVINGGEYNDDIDTTAITATTMNNNNG